MSYSICTYGYTVLVRTCMYKYILCGCIRMSVKARACVYVDVSVPSNQNQNQVLSNRIGKIESRPALFKG